MTKGGVGGGGNGPWELWLIFFNRFKSGYEIYETSLRTVARELRANGRRIL